MTQHCARNEPRVEVVEMCENVVSFVFCPVTCSEKAWSNPGDWRVRQEMVPGTG